MRTARSLFRILALAAVGASLSTAPALAAWPNSSTLNVRLSPANSAVQAPPVAASDGSGGAYVAWTDARNGLWNAFVQHVTNAGIPDPAWPAGGLPTNNVSSNQVPTGAVEDGAGGVIVLWLDSRNTGSFNVYAQHVRRGGTLDPAWPAAGVALAASPAAQGSVSVASDGAGGAFASWSDARNLANQSDIYAAHVLAGGTLDPGYPSAGLGVCVFSKAQDRPVLVGDGAGGFIVGWQDSRSAITPADIFAMHVKPGGVLDPAWPVAGLQICGAANTQQSPSIVTDGLGGAILAWEDARSGVQDIYAQHVWGNGTVDAAWPADGRAICAAPNSQNSTVGVLDGAGGALFGWHDQRSGATGVYAQHVLASGVVDPAWPVDGTALSTAGPLTDAPSATTDGSGGMIVVWDDARAGALDTWAQRVRATGTLDPSWPVNGQALSTASGDQRNPVAVSDLAGGVIGAWWDARSITAGNGAAFAQRIARGGVLGSPEGLIDAIRDVPNDNGGKVRVSWTASFLEQDPYSSSVFYTLYRSVPTHSVAEAVARGARLLTTGDPSLRPGDIMTASFGASTLFWELLASVNGAALPGYSFVAPTTGDSIGAGNPKTLFMVQTRTPESFWNSYPDSGYSVDNIPPVTPAPFAANYAAGIAHLHWNPNPDADLANYRLYRGTSPSFTPGPATLIASPPDTGWADAANATFTYKLTAVDVHGNESPVATLAPAAIAGVNGPGGSQGFSLAPAWPNPAALGTTLRFTLPADARVRLDIYDAVGRLVRSLASGASPAGEHVTNWNLRDESGRAVGAGLYFARLDADGHTRVRRIAVTP